MWLHKLSAPIFCFFFALSPVSMNNNKVEINSSKSIVTTPINHDLHGLRILSDCDAFMTYNLNGIEDYYTNELSTIACELRDSMPSEFQNDFMVIDFGMYPLLSFVDEEVGNDLAWQAMIDKVENVLDADYYLLMGKQLNPANMEVTFRVALKLPNTGVFENLNEVFTEGITDEVLNAINSQYNSENNFSKASLAEKAGVEKLIEYLTLIKGGLFGTEITKDLLHFAGFTGVGGIDNGNFVRTGNKTLDDEFRDYVGLESDGTPFYHNFLNVIPSWLPPQYINFKIIFTDNISYANGTDFSAASNDFSTSDAIFTFWFHYYKNPDSNEPGEMGMKMTSTITGDDAYEMLELAWIDFHANSPVAAITGNTGNNPVAQNSTPANKSMTGGCSDCQGISFTNFFSGTWTLKNEVLPCIGNGASCSIDFRDSDGDVVISEYWLGLGVGLMDGALEFTNFIALAANNLYQLATSADPDSETYYTLGLADILWSTEAFRKGLVTHFAGECETFDDALEQGELNHLFASKLYRDKVSALVSAFTDISKLKSVLTTIKDSMGIWFGELTGSLGPKITGYTQGKLIFEVLTTISVVKLVKNGVRTASDLSASFLKVINNPTALKDKLDELITGIKDSTRDFVCHRLGRGCFLPNTLVSTNKTATHINDIVLGQLVWTNTYVNKQKNYIDESGKKHFFDPFTSELQMEVDKCSLKESMEWKQLSLELKQLNGSISKIKLLRPLWWLKQNEINNCGDILYLSMPEMGCEGFAEVKSIVPFYFNKTCSTESDEDDYELQPITGIFEHISDDVWKLVFDDHDTLGVTGNHPIFSLDAYDWQLAKDLAVGETILGRDGNRVLKEKNRFLGEFSVFNLEVRKEHNFLVGKGQLVVHNSYWHQMADFLANPNRFDEVAEWWAGKYPKIFERGRFFEELMRKTKFGDWSFTGKGSTTLAIQGDGIANFWLIDFYKVVTGGVKVASMKTTILSDVGSWLVGANKNHVKKLAQRLDEGSFPHCPTCNDPTKTISNVVEVELHVFVKKDHAIPSNQTSWQNAIDAEVGTGKIKVILDEIERHL